VQTAATQILMGRFLGNSRTSDEIRSQVRDLESVHVNTRRSEQALEHTSTNAKLFPEQRQSMSPDVWVSI